MLLKVGAAPIIFVGGKGGVGKTTVASALGVHLAENGERVLVVSTDPAHSLGDIFDTAIGDDDTELAPGLHGMEIDADAEVDRYLDRVATHMREFVRPAMYAEIERQMELTRHSPGAAEAALLDRVADLMDQARLRYDRVIFDTAPTGHTLRLLALPEIMAAWTDGLLRSRERSDTLGRGVDRLRGRGPGGSDAGAARAASGVGAGAGSGDELSLIDQVTQQPADSRAERIRQVLLERRRRFSRARRLLLDPGSTAFILVLLPEKLPILETQKALDALRRHQVPVAGLVVNRVLPAEADGGFLEARREQEAEYLARISTVFDGVSRIHVPLLARDVGGMDALRAIGALLAEGGRT
ncbi:MAG TPA: ArsA family ATPase [Longimicrobiales bacterium]|nr:ArsA family ATPase [Longimicrobiales bacterium]